MPCRESGLNDASCRALRAERQDSIISGPLLKSRVSKKCRSNQRRVFCRFGESLSNGACTAVRSGGFFKDEGGGRLACNCSFVRLYRGTCLPLTGAVVS